MSSPESQTLHDDLKLLASQAPVANPPSVAELVKAAHAARRRRRTGMVAAASVVAVAVAGSALAVSQLDSPQVVAITNPSGSASAVNRDAFDVEGACPDEDRDGGWCPIDDFGSDKWAEVVEAFGGKVSPARLIQVPASALPDTVPEGTLYYVFEARIGAEPAGDVADQRAHLRVEVLRRSDAVRGEPTVEVHPMSPADFRYGEGQVLVVQADGTGITLRFWGADPDGTTSGGVLDAVDLFRRAVEGLSS